MPMLESTSKIYPSICLYHARWIPFNFSMASQLRKFKDLSIVIGYRFFGRGTVLQFTSINFIYVLQSKKL